MDIYDVVTKLVGPILPVGETNEDQRRLDNIKVLTNVVDRLLLHLNDAALHADRPQASMKAIGKYAKEYMDEVRAE